MQAVRTYSRMLTACEERLAHVVSGHTALLSAPANETLAAGGKRLRPLLVFCCAPYDRAGDPAVVSAATAVELVHMATLVHDDIIDGAALRRGKPTVVQAHGPATALRVGDFIFARAFTELTRSGLPRAIQVLAEASLALSRGELAQQSAAHDLSIGEEAYIARCRDKTAALFTAACRLGAMTGGAGRDSEERLATFGENVGLAFQIFDDILDLTGSTDLTGKRRGTDLRDGTVTLPLILALRTEPELAAAITAATDDADIDALCAHLASHDGTRTARDRALAYVAAAREAIDQPLDGVATDMLREIADGVVDRYG